MGESMRTTSQQTQKDSPHTYADLSQKELLLIRDNPSISNRKEEMAAIAGSEPALITWAGVHCQTTVGTGVPRETQAGSVLWLAPFFLRVHGQTCSLR